MDFSLIPFVIQYTDSLWAVLFVLLFIWVLKSNDTREKRYLNVIDQLSEKIEVNVVDVNRKIDSLNQQIASMREDHFRRE